MEPPDGGPGFDRPTQPAFPLGSRTPYWLTCDVVTDQHSIPTQVCAWACRPSSCRFMRLGASPRLSEILIPIHSRFARTRKITATTMSGQLCRQRQQSIRARLGPDKSISGQIAHVRAGRDGPASAQSGKRCTISTSRRKTAGVFRTPSCSYSLVTQQAQFPMAAAVSSERSASTYKSS